MHRPSAVLHVDPTNVHSKLQFRKLSDSILEESKVNREGLDICGIRLVRCCGLGPGLTLLQSQSHVLGYPGIYCDFLRFPLR